MEDFATVWRRSAVGELSWVTPLGLPVSVPVVPLSDGGTPCAALPLAHLDLVDALGERAAFSLTAPVPGTDTGLVGVGPVQVRLDPGGRLFGRDLVEQEAAKHPPTRLRAGSLMARKENWWWMARALVTLVGTDRVEAVRRRDRSEDALLVRGWGAGAGTNADADTGSGARTGAAPGAPATDGGPRADTGADAAMGAGRGADVRVDVVTARDWSAGPGRSVELWSRDGGDLSGRGGRVLVMGHQASPDFERWERWTRTGRLTGQILEVIGSDGGPEADPRPFRLLERLRNHREVERACRAGIRAVESRLGL
ncbi:hypothetical protein [Nocardiopsis sp. HUAS JQ3]|uniref:hypothetical protein n=1 Tax=Nocardiopsis sp. HUAS JQ3 TaxID=3061629 RepID=UPI0023A930FA|nr:hypothetical protein [Nocardiopsis sp. HUAS JQ3]WDZ93151.1 hypothetical protein PV789_11710 [Nocardiopsis sp. HUAS JQ3]